MGLCRYVGFLFKNWWDMVTEGVLVCLNVLKLLNTGKKNSVFDSEPAPPSNHDPATHYSILIYNQQALMQTFHHLLYLTINSRLSNFPFARKGL